MTCLAFSKENNLILLGNKNGQIILYNWPLFEKEEFNGSYQICVDNCPITDIILKDDKLVFVGTDSGNIFAFEIVKVNLKVDLIKSN